jgi:hypothetical protein
MDRFQLQYVYVLLLIVILQSCGTCSHRHVGTNGAGVSQVSHGREVWMVMIPKELVLSVEIRMGTGRRISMLIRLGKLKESLAISSSQT